MIDFFVEKCIIISIRRIATMGIRYKRPLNLIGFIVTILIATAILIAGIVAWIQSGHFGMSLPGLSFRNGLTASLVCVANMLAYLLAIITGLSYARSIRNIAPRSASAPMSLTETNTAHDATTFRISICVKTESSFSERIRLLDSGCV